MSLSNRLKNLAIDNKTAIFLALWEYTFVAAQQAPASIWKLEIFCIGSQSKLDCIDLYRLLIDWQEDSWQIEGLFFWRLKENYPAQTRFYSPTQSNSVRDRGSRTNLDASPGLTHWCYKCWVSALDHEGLSAIEWLPSKSWTKDYDDWERELWCYHTGRLFLSTLISLFQYLV